MGTDIHLFAEVLQPDGSWRAITTAGNPDWDEPAIIAKPFPCERCYDLFAVLANARNGRGFAGVVTGEPIEPMADPKGIPPDASPEIAYALENGDHSPSYHLLSEILSYPWTQPITKTGLVPWEVYASWSPWRREGKATTSPSSYCGDVWGPRVEIISETEANNRILDKTAFHDRLYVRSTWQEQLSHRAKSFWYSTVPQLLALGKPHHVRVCFFFDS